MKHYLNCDGGYIGRLAPTPSGLLHKGHALTFGTAFFRAYHLFAGRLYLRLEDLDRNRCKNEYSQAALEDLKWLGFHWEVHPDSRDDSGAVWQRDRASVYREKLREWARKGWIYPSDVSRKQLKEFPDIRYSDEGEAIFPEELRTPLEKFEGLDWSTDRCFQINWRWKVCSGEAIGFVDQRLGERRFVAGEDFGDFLVWSREGFPSYEMAVVLDDIDSGITEVVRGEDLLVSTARQLQIYNALQVAAPSFFHCPLVKDEQGVRLAKSSDSESVRSFRDRGYSRNEFWEEIMGEGMDEVVEFMQRS